MDPDERVSNFAVSRDWKYWAKIVFQVIAGVGAIILMTECLWQALDVVLHARGDLRGLVYARFIAVAFFVILLAAAYLLRLTIRVVYGNDVPKGWHLLLALAVAYFAGMFPSGLMKVHWDMSSGTRHNLEALRAALSQYNEDTKGGHAAHLDALTADRKYLREIPQAMPTGYDGAYHGFSSAVQEMTTAEFDAGRFSDAGGWAYVVSGSSAGAVVVNCTHSANRQAWTSY
jgi:hypothetical protein